MPSLLPLDLMDRQTDVLEADRFIPESCWSNKSYVEEKKDHLKAYLNFYFYISQPKC